MVPALEYQGITKIYRTFWGHRTTTALQDFSLSVEPGEIFGFLGPNGAGKTTAIHLALGFMRATSGQGRLLGHPFGHASSRARIGFLAENVALYHRPARELVEFYGALNCMPRTDLRRRVREVLEQVEMNGQEQRNVGRFSRGMLQRVGLAQALVNDPELLILDEPTSALDPSARVHVREILLDMRSRGRTVFLSSHLLSEVELICDRVAVIHHGCLVRVGRTDKLLENSGHCTITARGISAALLPGAVSQGGFLTATVPTCDQRRTIEAIWLHGGEVLSVNPARQSLEEMFLALVGEHTMEGAS